MGIDLAKEPIITAGSLARPYGVSIVLLLAVVDQLGIKLARLPNRRTYLSWEQAQRIDAEMRKRTQRTRAPTRTKGVPQLA